jgi:hypothetical protein
MVAPTASKTAKPPLGLRFSRFDAAVLLVSVIVTAAVWHLPTNPGVIVLTVVGHFFLFCNIVRLRRSFELVWAVSYVTLTFGTIALGWMSWLVPLAAVTPVTLALIAAEVRSIRHHGVPSDYRNDSS